MRFIAVARASIIYLYLYISTYTCIYVFCGFVRRRIYTHICNKDQLGNKEDEEEEQEKEEKEEEERWDNSTYT